MVLMNNENDLPLCYTITLPSRTTEMPLQLSSHPAYHTRKLNNIHCLSSIPCPPLSVPTLPQTFVNPSPPPYLPLLCPPLPSLSLKVVSTSKISPSSTLLMINWRTKKASTSPSAGDSSTLWTKSVSHKPCK